MSRRCSLIAKKIPSVGNKVSHSHRKTRRRFIGNVQNLTIRSEILKQDFRLKIAVSTLRDIDHNKGLDEYLLKTSNGKLTNQALKIKKMLLAKSPESGKSKTEITESKKKIVKIAVKPRIAKKLAAKKLLKK